MCVKPVYRSAFQRLLDVCGLKAMCVVFGVPRSFFFFPKKTTTTTIFYYFYSIESKRAELKPKIKKFFFISRIEKLFWGARNENRNY